MSSTEGSTNGEKKIDNNRIISLRSSDGDTFQVEEKAAILSGTVRHMIEDGMADDGNCIPLPIVNSSILSKIIEYCKFHSDKKGDQNDIEKNAVKDFDEDFANMDDVAVMFEILNAANYLDLKELVDLMACAAACKIKDKSVEEVRMIFDIENDYTPEEEEALRRETAWAFE